jgi:hypothetical protein
MASAYLITGGAGFMDVNYAPSCRGIDSLCPRFMVTSNLHSPASTFMKETSATLSLSGGDRWCYFVSRPKLV